MWTDVSGTGMTAETLVLPIIRNIGRKSGLIARLFFGVLALIPYLCFRKRRYGAAPPNIVSGTKKQCPRLRKALFVEPIKNLYDP